MITAIGDELVTPCDSQLCSEMIRSLVYGTIKIQKTGQSNSKGAEV